MLVLKKYQHRHKILKALQNYRQLKEHPNMVDSIDIELSFSDIVERTGLTETEVFQQLDYLYREDGVFINIQDFTTKYFITRNGSISYYDNKYISIGRKELITNTFDITKTLSTIILLIISVYTFLYNLNVTRDNKYEINNLKLEIQQLKIKVNKR